MERFSKMYVELSELEESKSKVKSCRMAFV